MNIFGENLRGARIAAGLTQEALAQRLGVVKQTIGNYERGEREPDLATLRTIAGALGVTLANLLDDSPATQPIQGGITMITLQDLLTVLDVPTVEVRVDMTSRLTSRVRFQPNNMAQLDDIVDIFGRYEVKSIECEAGKPITVTVARLREEALP